MNIIGRGLRKISRERINSKYRKLNKNKDVTLITQNCVGGGNIQFFRFAV